MPSINNTPFSHRTFYYWYHPCFSSFLGVACESIHECAGNDHRRHCYLLFHNVLRVPKTAHGGHPGIQVCACMHACMHSHAHMHACMHARTCAHEFARMGMHAHCNSVHVFMFGSQGYGLSHFMTFEKRLFKNLQTPGFSLRSKSRTRVCLLSKCCWT